MPPICYHSRKFAAFDGGGPACEHASNDRGSAAGARRLAPGQRAPGRLMYCLPAYYSPHVCMQGLMEAVLHASFGRGAQSRSRKSPGTLREALACTYAGSNGGGPARQHASNGGGAAEGAGGPARGQGGPRRGRPAAAPVAAAPIPRAGGRQPSSPPQRPGYPGRCLPAAGKALKSCYAVRDVPLLCLTIDALYLEAGLCVDSYPCTGPALRSWLVFTARGACHVCISMRHNLQP